MTPRVKKLLTAMGIFGVAWIWYHRLFASWAGDAIIHLRIAELFAKTGQFQFNLGENVAGSTSLTWTLMLASLFKLVGPANVPVLTIGLAVVLYIATLWGILTLAERAFKPPKKIGIIAALLFAAIPGVFLNSFNGMEAILLAALLVWALVFWTYPKVYPGLKWGLTPALFFILATTRPEGLLFALALTFVYLIVPGQRIQALLAIVGAGLGQGLVMSVNWYSTGSILSDSALSRLASGLRKSYFLGPIHIDLGVPLRFLIYTPIGLSLIVFACFALPKLRDKTLPPLHALMLLFGAGILGFYTFITGATHISRYLLPFMPILLLMAASGYFEAYERWVHHRKRGVRTAYFILPMLFLMAVFSAEYAKRQEHAGETTYNVAHAVENRETNTFISDMGLEGHSGPLRFALGEVQLRYFFSDQARIEVLSLDGRTGHRFGKYLNPKTGEINHAQFIRDQRPDIIQIDEQYVTSRASGEGFIQKISRLNAATPGDFTLDGMTFHKTKSSIFLRITYEPSPEVM